MMKMLVCTDGSEQSMKAVEEAAKIAGNCSINDITIINVYENKADLNYWDVKGSVRSEDIERFKELIEEREEEESKNILLKAKEVFTEKNMEVETMFKEGHPAQVIANVANEKNFDMVVIGSRGYGGLKKLFLGSVSNSVIQEAKCNVLVVK